MVGRGTDARSALVVGFLASSPLLHTVRWRGDTRDGEDHFFNLPLLEGELSFTRCVKERGGKT